MNWTELLTREMTATYQATDNMVGMLKDSDLDWKPATGENWMTVGQLLAHLNTSCGMCCQGFVTGDWGLPEDLGLPEGDCDPATESNQEPKMPTAEQMATVASIAEAREALAADRDLALQMLEKAGEENLATLKSAAPWEPDSQLILGHHLLHMVNHLAIHKAQLFYYLKLMGHKVDTMTLWGM